MQIGFRLSAPRFTGKFDQLVSQTWEQKWDAQKAVFKAFDAEYAKIRKPAFERFFTHFKIKSPGLELDGHDLLEGFMQNYSAANTLELKEVIARMKTKVGKEHHAGLDRFYSQLKRIKFIVPQYDEHLNRYGVHDDFSPHAKKYIYDRQLREPKDNRIYFDYDFEHPNSEYLWHDINPEVVSRQNHLVLTHSAKKAE